MKSNNSPYEQQRLKTCFSPYKNRKNKTSFEKNSFGKNLGGGENKDTQIKLKNYVEDTHEKKLFSLSINANLTLSDP